MASAFGHAAAAFGFSKLGFLKEASYPLLFLGIALSILPDIDSVGFLFNVPYASFWGHRGFSHSIFFAALVSISCTVLFRFEPNKPWMVFTYLFISCLSHSLLDAMTTGGLGVAFFSPFENSRYFFPFRPIKVSPINVHTFFQGKGLAVLKSETIWIGIPTLVVYVFHLIGSKKK